MADTKRAQILAILKKSRVIRPRDVEAAGISRTYLNKLYAEGILDRPSRGLYVLMDDEPGEQMFAPSMIKVKVSYCRRC
jgi:predicted transcriptional regulator of viral defense system